MEKINKLIVIGFIGSKSCYLNVDMDTAIARYIKTEDITLDEFHEYETGVDEFEFNDEFSAYEVYPY